MIRKVALIGPSTLMISLPAKWAKENRIKRGDELEVLAREGELVVTRARAAPSTKKVQLEKKDIGAFHDNLLPFLYHKGYDEVHLIYLSDEAPKVLQQKIEDLMGYEIVSEGKSSITIKNVAETNPDNFDALLRRTFLLLMEMAESSYAAFAECQYIRLGEISLLEKANNKYTNFLKRSINKFGYKERENAALAYVIVRELEEIADIFRDMCLLYFREEKSHLRKEILNLMKDTTTVLRLFYEIFYKFDAEKAESFHLQRKKMLDKGKEMVMASHGKEALLLYYILSAQQKIFDLYGPYYTMHV